MSLPAIKNCAVCGQEPAIKQTTNKTKFRIVCPCGKKSGRYVRHTEAIIDWNARQFVYYYRNRWWIAQQIGPNLFRGLRQRKPGLKNQKLTFIEGSMEEIAPHTKGFTRRNDAQHYAFRTLLDLIKTSAHDAD